jgi:hypothetical protein
MNVLDLAYERFGKRRPVQEEPTSGGASLPVEPSEPDPPEAPVHSQPWEPSRCLEGCEHYRNGCTQIKPGSVYNVRFILRCPLEPDFSEQAQRCVICEHGARDGCDVWCRREPGRYQNPTVPHFRCPQGPCPTVVALSDVLTREELDRRISSWQCRTCPSSTGEGRSIFCTPGGFFLRWRGARCSGPGERPERGPIGGRLIDEVLRASNRGEWWPPNPELP